MARVFTFINMKGGVGKTTLATNVAYGLAHFHGKRVLLVDIDPQFNASTYLMDEDSYIEHIKTKKTTLDIFRSSHKPVSLSNGAESAEQKEIIKLEECVHNLVDEPGLLDIIPSELNLMELQMSNRGTENRLMRFIEQKCGGYDYVILDCPPTISFFTQAAILASDAYVVPLRPDPLASIGLPLLEKWLSEYTSDTGHKLIDLGIILSYVRGPLPNTMRDVIKNIRVQRGEKVFKQEISERDHIASSVESHLPVFLHKPDGTASKQMRQVINEFKARIDKEFK